MKKSFIPLYFIVVFLISLAWHTPLVAQPAADKGPYARINLIPERDHVNAGDIIFIAIEQDIAPGWHTYWVNPGDSGEPLRIKWDLPEGFEAGDDLGGRADFEVARLGTPSFVAAQLVLLRRGEVPAPGVDSLAFVGPDRSPATVMGIRTSRAK